jgi:hypothetical protein
MAALGHGQDVSGSVLLTWHEKVGPTCFQIVSDSLRQHLAVSRLLLMQVAHRGRRSGVHRPGHDRSPDPVDIGNAALYLSLLSLHRHHVPRRDTAYYTQHPTRLNCTRQAAATPPPLRAQRLRCDNPCSTGAITDTVGIRNQCITLLPCLLRQATAPSLPPCLISSLHQFASFGPTIVLFPSPAPRSLLAVSRLLAQVEGDIPVLDHVSGTHQLISPSLLSPSTRTR